MIENIKSFFFTTLLSKQGGFATYEKIVLFLISIVFLYCLSLLFITILRKKIVFKNSNTLFKETKKILLYIIICIIISYFDYLFHINKLSKFFYVVIIFFIIFPIKTITDIIIKIAREKIADRTESNIDNIIFDILSKFMSLIVILFAIATVLDLMGINIMPLIAGAGIFGLAIGFAAKDALSNLIAGVMLMIARPFEVGHWISLWDKSAGSSWGKVVEVGIRATKIQTADNIIIIVPNNEIMTRDIINYSISSPEIRIKIDVGVAYDTDLKKASEIVKKSTDNIEGIMKEPEAQVFTMNFGESSIDLQLRVWIYNSEDMISIKSKIMNRIKEEFDKNSIEIPFPQRDVTIKS